LSSRLTAIIPLLREPRIETIVGSSDQASVEPARALALFVAGDEKHGAARRIEREGHPPDAARGIEAELLQVGVARSFERVHPRPPQRRPEPREQPGVGQQLVLDLRREQLEFRVEPLMKDNRLDMLEYSPRCI
jgi:hypothetical protein